MSPLAKTIIWTSVLFVSCCQGLAQETPFRLTFSRSDPTRPQSDDSVAPETNVVINRYLLELGPENASIQNPYSVPTSRYNFSEEREQQRIETAIKKYMADAEERASIVETEKREIEPNGSALSTYWNHGFEIANMCQDFRLHVGGQLQFDAATMISPSAVQTNINTPYRDGVDFRRARFRLDGTMYANIDWVAEFDFMNSSLTSNQTLSPSSPSFTETAVTAPTDLWVQTKEVPLFGIVRLGNQKEQIGFEHIVSSRFQPFMERSFNQDTFYGGTFNGFSPGIQFFRNYGANDRGLISGGVFKPVNSVFGYSIGDFDYSITGRATRLLWYEDDGASLLHLGLSGRQSSAVENQGIDNRYLIFRTRDAVRAGLAQDWPSPASITLFGDDQQTVNAELAAVLGPWTMQAEYLVNGLQDARAAAGGPLGETAVYHGGYIQILRFLTDDHDHYEKKIGAFERVKPRENFSWSRNRCGCSSGLGAWQVGGRYNYLDLNDEGLNGGVLHNMTFGVNWFWNPNMKLQTNYIATYRDVSDTVNFPNGSGWIHGFGTRMAIDF